MSENSPSGSPPKSGWANMVPELLVEDITASMGFWTGPLGFAIAYQRVTEKFAYLEHPDGAQVMLCQRHGGWETGAMQPPLGQGVMFQIYVSTLDPILAALKTLGHPLYSPERITWRDWGDRQGGAREAFVTDPDGYLLMLAERLGERPLPA